MSSTTQSNDIDDTDGHSEPIINLEAEKQYLIFHSAKSFTIRKAIVEVYSESSNEDIESWGDFEREATENIRDAFLSGELINESNFDQIKNVITGDVPDLDLAKSKLSKKPVKLRSNSELPFFSKELQFALVAIKSSTNPLFQLDRSGSSIYDKILSALTLEDNKAREQMLLGEKPDSTEVREARVAESLGITKKALDMKIKKLHALLRTFYPISISSYNRAEKLETVLKLTKHLQSPVFNFPEKVQFYLSEKQTYMEKNGSVPSYNDMTEHLDKNIMFRELILSKEELKKGIALTSKILRNRVLQPITRKMRKFDNMLRPENVRLLTKSGVKFLESENEQKIIVEQIKRILFDLQSTYDCDLLSAGNRKHRERLRAKFDTNSRAA